MCVAKGNPRPVITWYKDGAEIFTHFYLNVSSEMNLNFARIRPIFADTRVEDRHGPDQEQAGDRPGHADGCRSVRVHGGQHVLDRPALVQDGLQHRVRLINRLIVLFMDCNRIVK